MLQHSKLFRGDKMKWLKWWLKPFTKPHYKLTMVDSLKGMVVVFVIIGILFVLYILIYKIMDKRRK